MIIEAIAGQIDANQASVALQLAQDTAAKVQLWTTIGIVVQTSGAVLIAWLAFLQTRLNKNMVKLETNTNSMREQLVNSVAKQNRAEGNVEGRSDLKQEQKAAKMLE